MTDPVAAVSDLLEAAAVIRRGQRRHARALWAVVAAVVLAVAVAIVVVVTVFNSRAAEDRRKAATDQAAIAARTEQIQREVHNQICHIVAITYQGPAATTAAGRSRQEQTRQFARTIGCDTKD